MNLLAKPSAIFDRVIDLLAVLAIVLIVFGSFSVCLEVVMRYFLNRPLIWVVEVTEYILVLSAFLGAAWVLKKKGHTVIDVVLTQLDPRNQALLNTITSIIGAIICLVIAWYSAQTTWDHFQRDVHLIKALELPKAPFLSVIVLGSFLLFIQFLRQAYEYLGSWRGSRNKEQRSVKETRDLNL